jgi:TRAP-type C4-dicarboxylate transport system permease small subunit
MATPLQRTGEFYHRALVALVMGLNTLAGFSIVFMMLVTCTDVVMRLFGHPLKGSYDLVQIAGALCIACALPYTTAVKGHVAVEFLYLKLGRRSRLVVDVVVRTILIALFAILTVQSIKYGASLHRSGEVTPTLEIPLYGVMYLIAFSCVVVALVVLFNLLNPKKELIKP